jgi:hypothetical protein
LTADYAKKESIMADETPMTPLDYVITGAKVGTRDDDLVG